MGLRDAEFVKTGGIEIALKLASFGDLPSPQEDSTDDEGVVSDILHHIFSWEGYMVDLKRVLAVTAAGLLICPMGICAVPTMARTGVAAGARSMAVSVVDPVCKVVLDANHKTLDTANHLYMDNLHGDGKKVKGELITVNGERYLLMDGKWIKSRMTVADSRAQEEENIKNAKVLSCKRIGDDTVGGEVATIYTEHTENEDTKSDGKIWISKSRGVILKEEIDLDSGDPLKEHIAMRYEYANVKAPV
jgi:hypothetical protein